VHLGLVEPAVRREPGLGLGDEMLPREGVQRRPLLIGIAEERNVPPLRVDAGDPGWHRSAGATSDEPVRPPQRRSLAAARATANAGLYANREGPLVNDPGPPEPSGPEWGGFGEAPCADLALLKTSREGQPSHRGARRVSRPNNCMRWLGPSRVIGGLSDI